MESLFGLTASDALMLATLALIAISLMSIYRRNGNGNGHGSAAADAERISSAWRALTQEQRHEIEIRDAHIALLMGQLSRARIEPATHAQAESIYDTIKQISDEFSIDELDTLMLAVNIRPDQIGGDTIDERARELVLMADRRGKLAQLILAMHKERP